MLAPIIKRNLSYLNCNMQTFWHLSKHEKNNKSRMLDYYEQEIC